MGTSFPTSIDALTNPTGSDPFTNPDHASQHANLNDAMEAVQTQAIFLGCRAYHNSQQTVSAATETTVLFDTEEYDTNAMHTGGGLEGRFTIPNGRGGKWRFNLHFFLVGSHGGSYVYLRKNGTTAIAGSESDDTATTDKDMTSDVTIVLAANDYIEARGYRSTGTTFGGTSAATRNSMEATFLGA